MWVVIVTFFFTNIIWVFYLLFEINIVPIVLILIGWGINIARMRASIYIILYTSLFSFPVIIIILNNIKLIISIRFYIGGFFLNLFSKIIIILIFMVKIPIFRLHYWLPKAHVEASTIGSIILARGLLKIGGLGFIKIMLWSSFYVNNSWLIIGSAIRSWLCCLQRDQKKLIALRSVSHISFSAARITRFLGIGHNSSILYGFTHSITRSIMFYNRGVISSQRKTRLLNYIPKIPHFIMILIITTVFINLGIPPRISFLPELISVTRVFNESYLKILIIFIIITRSLLFSFIYCIILYQSVNYSQHFNNSWILLTFYVHLIFIVVWWNINLIN